MQKVERDLAISYLQQLCPNWMNADIYRTKVLAWVQGLIGRASRALSQGVLPDKRFAIAETEFKSLFKSTGFPGTVAEWEKLYTEFVRLSDPTIPSSMWLTSWYRAGIGIIPYYAFIESKHSILDPVSDIAFIQETRDVYAKLKTYFSYIDPDLAQLAFAYLPGNSTLLTLGWFGAVRLDAQQISRTLHEYYTTLQPIASINLPKLTERKASRLVTSFMKAYYRAKEKKAEEEKQKERKSKQEKILQQILLVLERFVMATSPDKELAETLVRIKLQRKITTKRMLAFVEYLHDPSLMDQLSEFITMLITRLYIDTTSIQVVFSDMLDLAERWLKAKRVGDEIRRFKNLVDAIAKYAWDNSIPTEQGNSWDKLSTNTKSLVRLFTVNYIIHWLETHMH